MKILDVELEDIDLLDLEVAEKVERAVKKIEETEKNISSVTTSLSEKIKEQCNIIFDFFNDIWGEGTDKKVFGNKTNLGECYKAYTQVLDNFHIQKENLSKTLDKYSNARINRRS